MSLRKPSQVSATTGRLQSGASRFACAQAIVASWTAPTLWVLVIITAPSRMPRSRSQVVPVISPLPFRVNQAANTRPRLARPRGRTAVTPVRTGPSPTTSFPSPRTMVWWPTSIPATSVMAFSGPGVPAKGTPRSRARGPSWANAGTTARPDASSGAAKSAKRCLMGKLPPGASLRDCRSPCRAAGYHARRGKQLPASRTPVSWTPGHRHRNAGVVGGVCGAAQHPTEGGPEHARSGTPHPAGACVPGPTGASAAPRRPVLAAPA